MTNQTPCIKHEYRLVNNRYDKNGNIVIEGGEWKSEKRCEKCGCLFEIPNWALKLLK
jgi:hypothetical protein